MKILNNILLLSYLLFITGCGYSPLISKTKTSLYFNEIKLEGNLQINSQISKHIKKYKTNEENQNSYNLKIFSKYEKIVTNKDNNGNPKNYNLITYVNIVAIDNIGREIKKSFQRKSSLSSKRNKTTENELERKYKSDLSRLITEDIIFFLSNR
tara:strand:- start:431 stop:892 length:462 start_codon:yes stop_codon:yes gene_type:complete